VLIADSDAETRGLFADTLMAAGFHVVPVAGGMGALVAARRAGFDLFVAKPFVPRSLAAAVHDLLFGSTARA
jgi:DNA-binding response OmpR family regulator